MYYETDKNDHGLRYNPLKACVVPQPIGWISTVDAAGVINLAPFSFFNLLSYDPPFVLFSAFTRWTAERRIRSPTWKPLASSSTTWRRGLRRIR
jgi:flavin reductase (DIM6/NTAB) family NADH-FMN oxidoreductase RutF